MLWREEIEERNLYDAREMDEGEDKLGDKAEHSITIPIFIKVSTTSFTGRRFDYDERSAVYYSY